VMEHLRIKKKYFKNLRIINICFVRSCSCLLYNTVLPYLLFYIFAANIFLNARWLGVPIGHPKINRLHYTYVLFVTCFLFIYFYDYSNNIYSCFALMLVCMHLHNLCSFVAYRTAHFIVHSYHVNLSFYCFSFMLYIRLEHKVIRFFGFMLIFSLYY
jgi:hypothetical protein